MSPGQVPWGTLGTMIAPNLGTTSRPRSPDLTSFLTPTRDIWAQVILCWWEPLCALEAFLASVQKMLVASPSGDNQRCLQMWHSGPTLSPESLKMTTITLGPAEELDVYQL